MKNCRGFSHNNTSDHGQKRSQIRTQRDSTYSKHISEHSVECLKLTAGQESCNSRQVEAITHTVQQDQNLKLLTTYIKDQMYCGNALKTYMNSVGVSQQYALENGVDGFTARDSARKQSEELSRRVHTVKFPQKGILCGDTGRSTDNTQLRSSHRKQECT